MFDKTQSVAARSLITDEQIVWGQREISDVNPLNVLFQPKMYVDPKDSFSPQFLACGDVSCEHIASSAVAVSRIFDPIGNNRTYRFWTYSFPPNRHWQYETGKHEDTNDRQRNLKRKRRRAAASMLSFARNRTVQSVSPLTYENTQLRSNSSLTKGEYNTNIVQRS